MNQARQFITHRHLMIGDQEISLPSYLVSVIEEGAVTFKQNQLLADAEHPGKVVLVKGETPKAQSKEKNRSW